MNTFWVSTLTSSGEVLDVVELWSEWLDMTVLDVASCSDELIDMLAKS